MLIANAGHLPPYRNGIALDLPGSLPLGILSDVDYDMHTVQLDPADHLTFLTDGVLEARNSAGQLLGFEQTAQLSSLPPDAIAQAAIHTARMTTSPSSASAFAHRRMPWKVLRASKFSFMEAAPL